MFLNFFKNKCIYVLLIVFVILFLFFNMFFYSKSVSNDISDKVFRLHIVANSDSFSDQILKLKVRDALLNYMNSIINNNMSKNEILDIANKNIAKFSEIAYDTICKNGESYDVKVNVGNFFFPTKSYGSFSFPAGYYDALNIEIGNGFGHNWWCVMFPPLCFVDNKTGILSDDSINYLEENLSAEDYNIISQNDDCFVFKFKIVEIINNVFSKR